MIPIRKALHFAAKKRIIQIKIIMGVYGLLKPRKGVCDMFNMTTAAMNVSNVMGDAGMTVLIGLVVVFGMLLLLTGIFKMFGLVGGVLSGKPAEPKAVKTAPAPAAKPAAPAKPASKAPVVQPGISDEVVAAIAAAVAMMSVDGKTYAVRRISRVSGGRSAWAAAGVAENTRSF